MPQPAIATPVWPVGTKTDASPRSRAARSARASTTFLPITVSEPTLCTTCTGVGPACGPAARVRSGGDARRSRSSAPCARRPREARGRRPARRAGRPRASRPASSAASTAAARRNRASRRSAPRRSAAVGAQLESLVERRHDRHRLEAERLDLARRCGRRRSSRSRQRPRGCRSGSPRGRSCRSASRTVPRRRWRAARSCRGHPQAGRGRQDAAVLEAEPAKGWSASSRWPSRSTQSASEAIARRGRHAELRLDHAAEHHPQPQRARRVNHPDSLAYPARLRELHVDAVGVAASRPHVR